MTRYLLDTTTLIDFSKGQEPVRSRLLALLETDHVIAICAVNLAEFYAGIAPAERIRWVEFFKTLRYWDISKEAAIRAGQLRYEFARQGITLSTPDTLIAAVAEEQEAVIVTDNVKDYPAEGLLLLSLRNSEP